MNLSQKKLCTVPTWRGWLLLGSVLVLGTWAAGRALYPFLAPRSAQIAPMLVVEGWIADSALRQIARDPRVRAAGEVFVTGGPIDKGSVLQGEATHARVGALTLVKLGLDAPRVYVVASRGDVRDRTLAAALGLRQCLAARHPGGGELTLVTLGAHARRSRLVLARTLGERWQVRVAAIADVRFDAELWWRSSEGFRVVIGELLAYVHALLMKHPLPGSAMTTDSPCAAVQV